MVVTDPFDITVFWKVTRWEYVNVDSVTFRFSTVITWFRCSNYTDRLHLKKYRSTMATSRSQTRFVISQWILLVFLFADECRNPYHCLHTLICSDLKGTEKPLSSSSRRSQAWTAGNKPATNPVRNISVNIACFFVRRWAPSSISLPACIDMLRSERGKKTTEFSLLKYGLGQQDTIKVFLRELIYF